MDVSDFFCSSGEKGESGATGKGGSVFIENPRGGSPRRGGGGGAKFFFFRGRNPTKWHFFIQEKPGPSHLSRRESASMAVLTSSVRDKLKEDLERKCGVSRRKGPESSPELCQHFLCP